MSSCVSVRPSVSHRLGDAVMGARQHHTHGMVGSIRKCGNPPQIASHQQIGLPVLVLEDEAGGRPMARVVQHAAAQRHLHVRFQWSV